ncbi:hypothetical protein ACLOJK_025689 [Asimina triloba]
MCLLLLLTQFIAVNCCKQREVYERVMAPLVSDFLGGKSRLLAAMGPTASGKTHTVFGSPREPGLVPLALQRIFSDCSGGSTAEQPRVYYLSMFEICSERGKSERILDLSPDGGDLCFQQGSVKGLQEVITISFIDCHQYDYAKHYSIRWQMMVSDVTQAECFIARGMLKRATAATNANDRSSRSQCVISIRSASKVADDRDEFLSGNAIMTIVDLAGAEKERRTGNQGTITSLLEHQKTRRPLQKHYQNSLLTSSCLTIKASTFFASLLSLPVDFFLICICKDEMLFKDEDGASFSLSLSAVKEKTIAAVFQILTVKPGEEDYLDTSYMLRQSSPYVNIKFGTEEVQLKACVK